MSLGLVLDGLRFRAWGSGCRLLGKRPNFLGWGGGGLGTHWGNIRVTLGLYGGNERSNGNEYNGLYRV